MGLLSFFDRFRAYRADRSPWGDFYFEPVGAKSVSGMRVSSDAALRLAAVYACVRILSETMASLPVVVYRMRPDGGKDRIKDHWHESNMLLSARMPGLLSCRFME